MNPGLTHEARSVTLPTAMAYAKQWLVVLIIVVVLYAAVVGVAYLSQRSLLYFPTHAGVASRLQPWPSAKAPMAFARESPHPQRVWLMLHGNGGQAAHRDYILSCVGADDAVFVLEYPGYGLRPGIPSRAAFDQAASELYRLLRSQYPTAHLGVVGESLGTGPACALARETNPPDEIVLVTPFDTLANVAAKRMGYLPVRWILKDRWDNIAALRDYHRPIRIYAAEYDSIIPNRHARALGEAIGVTPTMIPSGHNDWASTGAVKL